MSRSSVQSDESHVTLSIISIFGTNVTQVSKNRRVIFRKNNFCGTAITKKGNDRHTRVDHHVTGSNSGLNGS